MNIKKTDLLLAILMCISWSSDYIITKIALESFSPIFFSSVRFFIVSLLIAPKLKRIPKKILTLILISFPLVVMVYGSVDVAIKLNSSITATNIIFNFKIITAMIASYFFLREKMTKRQIYGISIAFIGVIIVIISNTISNPFEILEQISSNGSEKNFFSYFDKNNIISLIFLFISVFSWPIYAIFSKKLSNEDVKESEIIGWTAFFGSFFGLIVSFIFEKNQIQSIQSANLIELSYFLYAALFGVLIPHTILHYLIKIYDVSKISGFSLLIPFFTAIGGVIFFGEKITLLLAIGGLILIFGLYISQSSKTENIAQVRSN